MSENYVDVTTSGVNYKLGPNLFGFYVREAEELLIHDEGLLPFPHQISHLAGNISEVVKEKCQTKSSCRRKENNGIIDSASLFSDGLGAQLSEFKRESLKTLLRQSVFSLTLEVDEMMDPVLSVCRIRACLGCDESSLNSTASCKDDQSQHHQKKCKVSHACSEDKLSDDTVKKCMKCHATETPQSTTGSNDTKFLCSSCELKYGKRLQNSSVTASEDEAGEESTEIDQDLRVILESDTSKVEELIQKYSGELSATLHHMEQKLEEFLDIIVSSCRPMSISEKQKLRTMIQNLPPMNLGRVAEIVGRAAPSENPSSDELYVELDELDNTTQWRLYFYIKNFHANTTTKIDIGE